MKKGLAAAMVVLAMLTVLALAAGVVLGDTSGSTAKSTAAAPAAAGARGVSAVSPAIIGFESDAAGVKTEPFASVDNPTVHFVDSLGSNLQLADFGAQSNGQALLVGSDDASAMVILFDVPTTKLSVAFGNDDPAYTVVGDFATLTVYRDDKKIKTINVTMNRDDIMNQTVQYAGTTPIDKAVVVYKRAVVGPINLIEIVDDLTMKWVYSIKGTNAKNTLRGNYLANGIYGGGGNDIIYGRGGNDILSGGAGNDKLYAGDGNDLIDAGGGNDTIVANDGVGGNDTIYGGPGTDSAVIDAGDRTVDVENVVVK